jgi:2-polyprenyl-3-methyl-5-hydroxy-6-metoxy-1,4-benzoquinol methylase
LSFECGLLCAAAINALKLSDLIRTGNKTFIMSILDHFGLLAPFYERLIKPKTPELLSSLLALPVDGLLLDAGGGTGRVAQFLVGQVRRVVVADLSCQMLAEASKKGGVQAVCTVTESLPFPDGAFERIIMVDALHHVIHQHETIHEMWRLLSPGGRMVIEEPDIRLFGVKLIALGEKLLLMRSHFLSPPHIARLFSFPDALVEIRQDGPIAFISVQKAS